LVNFKKAAWERSLFFIYIPAPALQMMKNMPGKKNNDPTYAKNCELCKFFLKLCNNLLTI
jgi:hypothetical protein